jgi:DNA repair protein RadC
MIYENKVPMHLWCADDRPSSKILLKGNAALSDSELLSIIIGSDKSKKRSPLECSRLILNHAKDNLGELAKLSVQDLTQAGNITLAQATRIITAFEIGRRRNASDVSPNEKITNSTRAFEIFRSVLVDKPYEEFWIMMLNRSNRLIGKCKISEGGTSGTVVDPKKIFKIAMENHCSSIILGHNHPSGNLSPSEADKKMTTKVRDAGALLDIDVLDHLILADDRFYSFADQGAM